MRIPRKNIRNFRGQPIIAYSIKTAFEAGIQRVIVSTDDAEVAMHAQWYGAEIHRREYDDGSKGTQEVTADVLRWLGNGSPEFACCVYATAPLMEARDLVQGLHLLKTWERAYVYSVMAEAWSLEVRDAGQWYWGRTQAFLSGVPLSDSFLCKIPPDRVCDINTHEDWAKAEMLYDRLRGIYA